MCRQETTALNARLVYPLDLNISDRGNTHVVDAEIYRSGSVGTFVIEMWFRPFGTKRQVRFVKGS